ncbi:hypothetical protein [Streptomyces alanosinicus]|uniref:Uncharacterized protein n=1 Tax=Streptomyces alanosinicus TaxID=68171 RepID=A0A918YN17_9ACTN|nr:hypothetical protein [Streptomyces alanosinicus]GHE10328.1 hypothetical protein GCM10010339_66070 [Streptomyces alanosinicus]
MTTKTRIRGFTGRLGRAVVAVGGALILATALGTSSHAATGTLTYVRADTGGMSSFDDPSDGFCYFVGGGALSAHNDTNSTALFFADSFCDPNQFVGAAQPGQGVTFTSQAPLSVRFGG